MVFKRFKGGTSPFLKAVVGPGSACRGCPQLFAGLNVRSGGSRGPHIVWAHRGSPVDDLFWKPEARASQHPGQDGE